MKSNPGVRLSGFLNTEKRILIAPPFWKTATRKEGPTYTEQKLVKIYKLYNCMIKYSMVLAG